ncbi:kinase-like domain-containing protein [Crassisporium funariophilum]|nr:kinase-like domain-containing protein [Crassisporium funariophilum]
MATILRSQPELFIGLNALLNPDYRLISSTSAIEVHYFVFTTWTGARILSISETKYRFPTSDRELRDIIVSKEAWKNLLDANPANLNKDWLTCISQLLQVVSCLVYFPCVVCQSEFFSIQVLDDPMTDALCARRAYRCLRELAMHSILPPSFFIRNLTREAGFAVQGGSFAVRILFLDARHDIYKGYMGTTKVCLRVLRMFVTTTLEEQESLFKDFCVEVLVWRQLKHPNILPFIGANTEIFRSQYCFISPWMEKGDLMSYLKANPLHDRFNSICEVVDGIEYLHGLDPPVTHKDIKGANILVKEDLSCCLADFGLSSVLESQRLRTSPALQGSVCFLAPERIDPGRSPVKNATASDVYALGCTVFEIYTGKPPLSDLRLPGSIMYAILQGRRPQLPPSGHWTIKENQLWSLVERCWSDNAEDRPRISQVKRILRDSCPRTLLLKDLARPPCQTFRPDVDYFDPRKVKDWLKEQHQSHALLSMCYSRDKVGPCFCLMTIFS